MATSSGPAGSPTHNAMDMNTPDVADGETQYGYRYLWNTKDLQIIEDYKQYHYDMWDFYDSLERDGPSLAEPRKPKADYKYLLCGGLSQD